MRARLTIGVLVVAGLAGAARAQAPDAAAIEDQAYQDFTAGRLAEALRGYERVYRLAPRAELLFAIGNLQQQLGQCDRAIDTLEDYLAGSAPAGAAKAKELIATCRAAAKPAPVVEDPAPVPVDPDPARDSTSDGDPGHGRRRAALIVGGVAVIAAGGAVVAELRGRAHLRAYERDGAEDEFTTANHFHYAAQGVAIAGGACAVAATYLWISGRRRGGAAVALAPIAGGAVVSWSGGF